MNIPGLTQIEIAELAGIEIPEDLITQEIEVQDKASHLSVKIEKLREQIVDAGIDELRKEAALVIADGGDDTSVQTKIWKAEQKLYENQAMLSELETLQPGAEEAILEAAKAIDGHINSQLVSDHAEMLRQLENAGIERARNIGTSRDGKYHSSAPKKKSQSCIAVCEACMQPIAIFDTKKISQPITGADFQPLGGYGTPFPPGCEFMWLRCPRCGNFPWREEDKILTSAGFFSVPSKEQEKND